MADSNRRQDESHVGENQEFIYRFTYLAIASKVSIENTGNKGGIVTAEYSKLYYGTVVLQIAVNNVINVKRK